MKIPLLPASAFLAIAWASLAQGQTTSVQFIGGGNAPLYDVNYHNYNYTAGAGANAVTNWNPVLNSGNNSSPVALTVTSGLMTSTGAASTLGFALTANSAYYTTAGNGFTTSPAYPGYNGIASGPGDKFLYSGFAGAGYFNSVPLTLTLNNLNPLDSYTIVAYVSPFTDFGQNQPISVGLVGGTTVSGTTDGGVGSYVQLTSGGTGNYVEFDNVTGLASQTLDVSASTSNYVGLSGFQVVDNGALSVPEPSTYALLLAGFVCLVGMARRRSV
jgi:hypothetical protein